MADDTHDLPPDFWQQLEQKYGKLRKSKEDWAAEHVALENIVESLRKTLEARYSIGEPLGVGGVGVVLKVHDKNLRFPCALKFPRPKVGKEDLFTEVMESEISSLLEARHPNIIQLYFQDKLPLAGSSMPFYIMEYIDEAQDAFEYFSALPRTTEEILGLISQVIAGLQHLHRKGIVHLDVKLENILVSPNGRAVISDLGSARSLNKGPEQTLAIFTRTWAHPALTALQFAGSTGPTEPLRMRVSIERGKLSLTFDLYALGLNIRRLLHLHEPSKWHGLDPYTRKYLTLMACRLLDGRNSDEQCALGLPRVAFQQIQYANIEEAGIDIKKVNGQYPLTQRIPELDEYGVRTLQASSSSPTPFTPRLGELVTNALLQRLSRISQLGFISFIYPTATHTRLEHSLGTYSNVVRYCNALYHDPINPFFRQVMTEEDLKAVLLAGLCHDLGQYPLAHDFEDAVSNAFSHEEITVELLESVPVAPAHREFQKILVDEWGASPSRVAAVISANPFDLDSPLKDRILHTLIDGPIDADKLDYLVRDSINSGVPFGRAIDFDRLLRSLTIIYKDDGRKVYAALGIHEKGRIAAETVAFCRYAMFGSVYWHHASRAAKTMLHRAIWEAFKKTPERAGEVFRAEFRSFVMGLLDTAARQTDLFAREVEAPLPTGNIGTADLETLDWLAQRTTEPGKELLNMICTRQLYKRLLVVSSRKSPHLWDSLVKFAEKWEEDWEMKIDLQDEVQRKVVDYVRAIDPKDRTTSALELTATDAIVAMHEAHTPLILVDLPMKRPGDDLQLEYLPEVDRRDTLQEWQRPMRLEDSIISTQVHEHLQDSASKSRIFCHPAVRETLEAGIPKNDLENILDTSLKVLQKKKRAKRTKGPAAS